MGNKLFDALTTKDLVGENGMPTHSSSGSFVVDLFYKMGGYRNGRSPRGELVGLFFAAFGENPNLAVKCLLNLRDPRGGMGERRSGRILWHVFAKAHPEVVKQLLPYIPTYARWDDLWYLLGTPVEEEMLGFYLQALLKGDALAAKWAVREGKRGPEDFQRGAIAKICMEKWNMTPKEYRGLLSYNTKVVETLMCSNLWDKIQFEHVPSQAVKKYAEAFEAHCEYRWQQYLALVESGEKKIQTGTLTPVEILHQYLQKGVVDKALELLWKNLKDYVPENLQLLPICDLSGSMFGGKGLPAEVSLSLGFYLAQRNKSIFRNGFITFSRTPKLITLTGNSLWDNIQQMRRAGNFAENTNLEATFDLILDSAVRAKLSQEDMPTHLLIISDMQFDQCAEVTSPTRNSWSWSGKKFDDTALEMIKRKYAKAGYTVPNIIFWNVDTSTGIPAKVTDSGVALVSGYSPSLMASVLSANMNPLNQVLAILNNGRYSFVDEIL